MGLPPAHHHDSRRRLHCASSLRQHGVSRWEGILPRAEDALLADKNENLTANLFASTDTAKRSARDTVYIVQTEQHGV